MKWWRLIRNGEPIACVVAAGPLHVMPVIGDLFYGGKGCGEFVPRGRGLFEFNVYNDCWEYRAI